MVDGNDPWGKADGVSDRMGSNRKAGGQQFRGFLWYLREALGRFSSNGGGGGGNTSLKLVHILTGAVILLCFYGCTGFYIVNPEEKAVELLFGKYYSVASPGLRYWFPHPIGKVLKVGVETVSKEEIGSSLTGDNLLGHGEGVMLTGDENVLNISFDVQWKVGDAYSYLFNVRDSRPGATVKSAAESAMREIVGKNTLAFAIGGEGRAAIAHETKKLLQSVLDHYVMGVEVLSIQLRKVDPPEKVISSFRDVQSARADKERVINEAHAYRNEVIPKAKGEAMRIKLDAEAYRSEVVNRAEGDAGKFLAIYKEYSAQPDAVRNRMYLEMMEDVLRSIDKVVITDDNMKGMFSYLPLADLYKKK